MGPTTIKSGCRGVVVDLTKMESGHGGKGSGPYKKLNLDVDE